MMDGFMELFAAYSSNKGGLVRGERIAALSLRLLTMAVLVAVLTLHVRSLKIFRWEQSVTGGVLVTYLVAVVGLTLCTGMENCHGTALQPSWIYPTDLLSMNHNINIIVFVSLTLLVSTFQAYLCSTGAALLLVNAGTIWHRWKNTGEATQAMAELLSLLGVALKRQVKIKVTLCVMAAVMLMLDVAMVPIIKAYNQNFNKK